MLFEKFINIYTTINRKTCYEYNCNKFPVYGYKNDMLRCFCKTHKKENMINVNTKRCRVHNCNKHPSFGYKEDKIRLFCYKHRNAKTINLTIVKCEIEDCDIAANYGFKGKRRMRCVSHKTEEMVSLRKNQK